MLIIDAERVASALTFDKLVPALRSMFRQGCEVPPRHHHSFPADVEGTGTLLLMPSWKSGSYLGVKIVAAVPGNSRKGLPALSSTYLLSDANTGFPLALIDGNQITPRRTAAASALAADYLARKDARHLLVVGSGKVASLLPHAYAAVRPIESVSVWNHRPEGAHKLAAWLREEGFKAGHVEDLATAVGEADMVSCATLSTKPLIQGAWLRPGTHLDLIGGFTPAMREVDDEALRRSTLFLDTLTGLHEAGDLVQPLERGVISEQDVRGTLEDLCKGAKPGRRDDAETTLFKSVGTALEDLAAAILVLEREVRTTD